MPIALFDIVELLEPVDHARAGAHGGVLEFVDAGRVAQVEIIDQPELGILERVVYVPVEQLRLVEKGEVRDARTG